LPGFGDTPLVDAAAPLLQLLARLRNTASAPDAGDLRERVVQEIQAFDARARAAEVPPELLRSASYALCASIDDVAINTPWGNTGGWAQRTLLATFHPDLAGRERFFEVLTKVRSNPEKFEPLIELMYLCLSLGYMGSFRAAPRGIAEIEKIRAETYDVIQAKRGAFAPALSPSPDGVAAPYRPKKARLPVWVAAAAGLAALGGLFFWVSTDLAATSDGVTERMLASAPAAMPQIARAAPVQPPPPPPPPDQPTLLDKLRTALKPEIEQGVVAVVGTESTPVVRVRNRNMFAGGSAKLQPAFVPVLEHVGAALSHEPGQVVVAGYTDNQPIHTVQFPSNFQLSAARATAAKDVLARSIGQPARVASEGRADADPIAPNNTAEGREQNRRIEIILRREG
jgi:type VI secretion system protein ImpK